MHPNYCGKDCDVVKLIFSTDTSFLFKRKHPSPYVCLGNINIIVYTYRNVGKYLSSRILTEVLAKQQEGENQSSGKQSLSELIQKCMFSVQSRVGRYLHAE